MTEPISNWRVATTICVLVGVVWVPSVPRICRYSTRLAKPATTLAKSRTDKNRLFIRLSSLALHRVNESAQVAGSRRSHLGDNKFSIVQTAQCLPVRRSLSLESLQ